MKGANPGTRIEADLILLHAPSVFDFRNRDDMLFAYLSDSDSVNVTTIYEMFPLGFFSIQQRLRERGLRCEIINLASIMLQYPDLEVDALLQRLDAPAFGLDIHWMVHCHGAIEVAGCIKIIHPESLTICGGISSTYYAEELIRYPSIDIVVQGYDTLDPVTQLIETIKSGERRFKDIPNLLYKKGKVEVIRTGFVHKPKADYNAATVDWGYYKPGVTDLMSSPLIMTLPNTGCAMDCGWCGGSRYAYRNIMGVERTLIQKNSQRILDEVRSMGEAAKKTTIYALQCYSETKVRLHEYLDVIGEMGYKSVALEQFHLTPEDTLEKFGKVTRGMIMLSPESHDIEISRLAGRGTYTMEEMEAWIPRALDNGVGVMIWFFIGMPKQTKQSVMETVEYCEKIIRMYPHGDVLPLLCPMVPFLDPGSKFFEQPEKHGYRVFFRTMEEHRQAMIEPLWYRRLNYETNWMSRHDIQSVTYEAIGRLIRTKGEFRLLPQSLAVKMLGLIDETRSLLSEMERSLYLDGKFPAALRETIRAYNGRILAHSSDQIIPTEREFGGRWFDDFTVSKAMIDACRRTTP